MRGDLWTNSGGSVSALNFPLLRGDEDNCGHHQSRYFKVMVTSCWQCLTPGVVPILMLEPAVIELLLLECVCHQKVISTQLHPIPQSLSSLLGRF